MDKREREYARVHFLRAQLFALNRILMYSSRSFAAGCVDYALCLTCVNKAEANSTTPRTRQEEFFEPLDVVVQARVRQRCYRSFKKKKKSVSRLPEKANSRSVLNSGIISWHLTLQGTVSSFVGKGERHHLKFLLWVLQQCETKYLK